MKPLRIVADDKIPFLRGRAEQLGSVKYLPGASIAASDVRDADVLVVRTRTRCNKALLAGSQVKFVATATIGYDHIDTAYLAEAGIGWANCPGCNAASVAQYVENSLLCLEEERNFLLRGKTVGIIGLGHVGSEVFKAVSRLGCRIVCSDPPVEETLDFLRRNTSAEKKISRPEKKISAAENFPFSAENFLPLEQLAREADIVTFHTPLTYTGKCPTYHLANASFFDNLKPGAVLLNTSRGEVVETSALLRALDSGRVGEAVIDTWEDEPCINTDLLRRAFIATPHIAGYSADGKANGTRMALEAVAAFAGRHEMHFDIRLTEASQAGNAAYPPESPLFLYDPRLDSQRLKNSPRDFEKLRGDYPFRRERK